MIALVLLANVWADGGPRLEAGEAQVDAGPSAARREKKPAQLTADLEGSGLLPGEVVTLVLRVRYSKNSSLDAPETLPEGKGMMATGLPKRSLEADGDDLLETLRYPLVILDVGEVRSPSFQVRIDDQKLQVPALPLQVMDAGPSPQAPEVGFKPMVVLRPGPPASFYWVLGLIGVLALLALLVRFWPRAQGAETVAPAVVIDPYEQALKDLKLLRKRLKQPTEQRQAWFELLAILRAYLDARFGLNTAESTSEEILEASTETALPGVPRKGLKDLLDAADQVRYAGAEADREAIADLLDLVEGWIRKAEKSQRSISGGSA
ncbi:MAG: hypothetical protein CMH55_07105 [Myxococcales bacterium]|nr:hypothetical protein [Myxococcales bacterium]